MPPKRGIVKSGNAGNSSKKTEPSAPPPTGEKALFPTGYKYPLSLLNERCQKEGWEKPVVDTFRRENGFLFSVTLARMNRKTSERETVRLSPPKESQAAITLPTALEARHWGAVYAMYRFCNSINLKNVLPPSVRDYWTLLAAEHKAAPEHQQWMYHSDPFAARKEVDERQAAASKRRTERENPTEHAGNRSGPVSNEFSQAPEAKMAAVLRDLVEASVKKAVGLYPEAAEQDSVVDDEKLSEVQSQLKKLGFKESHIKNATDFIAKPTTLSTNLLRSLSMLEAAIEYLVLYVPECDLPQRFLPSSNSSVPFISGAYSGNDNLRKRWVVDKAIKECGWPAHAVKECASDERFVEHWDLFIVALSGRLLGQSYDDILRIPTSEPFDISPDEVEAMGANYSEPGHIVMPLFSAPISLNILTSTPNNHTKFPRPAYTPMYLTSPSVPAYVRLHLLSQLLMQINAENMSETGEGFCMACMRILEDEWEKVETDPPEVSFVLRHIMPKAVEDPTPVVQGTEGLVISSKKGKGSGARMHHQSNDEIRKEFDVLCRSEKYMDLLKDRQKLPAYVARREFLSLLDKNRVVVVVGETGCGKTTQLPQFILDHSIEQNKGAQTSIIVTQPRRISAIGVSSRVSSERLDDGSVGYSIRGETKRTSKTKLMFCTTGVVLRRISSESGLKGVTHVVVDEVHERSIDGDFLLLELKELLQRDPSIKVILMSATINHEKFMQYFDGAPLLTVPGFTHPVTDLYLEDIVPRIQYKPGPALSRKGDDKMRQKINEAYPHLSNEERNSLHSLTSSEQIDYQLITETVLHIISGSSTSSGILVFLPGVQEIRRCIDSLRAAVPESRAVIYPLHANLSNEEQRQVFLKTSKWKIVAATNVAETSITIEDVEHVIDAGKVKEMTYKPDTNLSVLEETWITRAAARQRRGRAGRTRPGTCYKLYTRARDHKLLDFPVPEILRVPLESICLNVKVTKESEDVKVYLNRAISPPNVASIEKALDNLQQLGAIDHSKPTALGRHISMLPLDLRLAKMLVLGCLFQCVNPVITIASILSSKPLFTGPVDKRKEAKRARSKFLEANSDIFTDLKAYEECMALQSSGKSNSAIRSFCEENFISAATLREINALRADFLSNLSDLGFIPFGSSITSSSLNTNSRHPNLLKALVLGGLWPRVAKIHLPTSAIKFDQVQAGTVRRENVAKEFRLYDIVDGGGRVFIHPGSVMFENATWKSSFVVYFNKHETTKVFLRDVTEIPLYALMLFGGPVSVNHVGGGLTIGEKDAIVKLRAWPRIGILVNQLRRLLDAELMHCLDNDTTLASSSSSNPVIHAMLALLAHDGLSE